MSSIDRDINVDVLGIEMNYAQALVIAKTDGAA